MKQARTTGACRRVALQVDGREPVDEARSGVAVSLTKNATASSPDAARSSDGWPARRSDRGRPACPPTADRAGIVRAAVRVDGEAERLGARLVLVRVVDEAERCRASATRARAASVPAREHARGRVDVGFGVVADAAGEQLHQLAAEVFLGCAFVFVSPSSQMSIAGSWATATSRSRKLPSALSRNSSICPRCFAGPRTPSRPSAACRSRLRPRRRPSSSRSRSSCARRASSSPGAADRRAPSGTATAAAHRR